jgi:hypothetical protein
MKTSMTYLQSKSMLIMIQFMISITEVMTQTTRLMEDTIPHTTESPDGTNRVKRGN